MIQCCTWPEYQAFWVGGGGGREGEGLGRPDTQVSFGNPWFSLNAYGVYLESSELKMWAAVSAKNTRVSNDIV